MSRGVGSPLFASGPPRPFAEVFPQVAAIRVEVEDWGHGVDAGRNKRIFTEFPGERIRCANPHCNGSFWITGMLYSRVRTKAAQNMMTVSVFLTYKPERAPCRNA